MKEIKAQAKDLKGLKFTAKELRYAFHQQLTGSMKLLNELLKSGIVKECGSFPNGTKIYEVA